MELISGSRARSSDFAAGLTWSSGGGACHGQSPWPSNRALLVPVATPTAADAEWRFRQVGALRILIGEQRDDLYDYLKKRVAGAVATNLKDLGPEQIEFARQRIGELHGNLTNKNQKQVLEQLEAGCVKVHVDDKTGKRTFLKMKQQDISFWACSGWLVAMAS